MIGSRSVYGRAPMRQLHSTPLLSLAVVTPEIKYIRRCHPCTRKCVSQAVLRRMQLTLHAIRRTPSGSSRLVLAMSAWSGKTRRLPSRHCREARVHDHTTAAMHERIHPPPVHPHLPGQEKPDVFRPGIAGRQESMIIRPRQCVIMSTPAPRPSSISPRQTRPCGCVVYYQ